MRLVASYRQVRAAVGGKVVCPLQNEVLMSESAGVFVKKVAPGCLSLRLMPLLCRMVNIVGRAGNWSSVAASVSDLEPSRLVCAGRQLILHCASRRRFAGEYDAKHLDVCALSKKEDVLDASGVSRCSVRGALFISRRDLRLLAMLRLSRTRFGIQTPLAEWHGCFDADDG